MFLYRTRGILFDQTRPENSSIRAPRRGGWGGAGGVRPLPPKGGLRNCENNRTGVLIKEGIGGVHLKMGLGVFLYYSEVGGSGGEGSFLDFNIKVYIYYSTAQTWGG